MSEDDRRFQPGPDNPDDDYDVGDDYAPAPPPSGAPGPDPFAGQPDQPDQADQLPPPHQQDPASRPRPGTQQPTAPPPAGGPPEALPYVTPAAGGTPPRGPAGNGSAPPAPAPAPYVPYAPPAQHASKRGRAWGCVVLVLVGLVVFGSCVAGFVTAGGDDDAAPSDPASGEPPDLDVAWSRTADDLAAGANGASILVPTLDGSFGGEAVLDAGPTWVARLGTDDGAGRVVVGLDPATGDTAWSTTFDDALGVVCDATADVGVVCLEQPAAGATLTGHVLDPATGAELATWPTDLESAAAVHLLPAGLLVVGDADPAPHARLAFLGLDGVVRWSLDVADLQNADLLFDDFLAQDFSDSPTLTMERLRWRDLPEGRVLLWSTPGVALIDTASGAVVVHECRRATAQGDAYYCADDDGVQRRGLDASVVWTVPGVDLAFPADVGSHDPIGVDDGARLYAFDAEAGALSEPLYDVDPATDWLGPSAVAAPDGDLTVVITPRAAIGVPSGSTTATWTHETTDRLWEAVVLGDVVVLDTSRGVVGLDAATGDELWQRSARYDVPGYTYVALGGTLAATGLDGLTAYELP